MRRCRFRLIRSAMYPRLPPRRRGSPANTICGQAPSHARGNIGTSGSTKPKTPSVLKKQKPGRGKNPRPNEKRNDGGRCAVVLPLFAAVTVHARQIAFEGSAFMHLEAFPSEISTKGYSSAIQS